ncbi:MAG: protein translocase subunit SecD [Vulcanimicrobiota bacterium]
MKIQNQVMVGVVLAICLLSVHLIYDFREGRSKLLLGLDLRSGSHIVVQLLGTGPDGKDIEITKDIQNQSIQVFRKRMDPEGNREVIITPEGRDRLIIEIPEVTDLAQAESMVKKAGRLEFRESQYDPETQSVKWVTRLDGSAVKRASAAIDDTSSSGSWMIYFDLTSEGAREFGDLTRELVGRPLGIFFDGEQVSAPTVNGPITGGQGSITGGFTQQEAVELANFLNAGALPVNVKLLESYTVSPTLGAESLNTSLRAGMVGLTVVVAYIVWYYRLLGVTASLALCVYSLLVLASMNIPTMQFVLTLPGIAGYILSIGMAVDANVLIYERIREELDDGHPLLTAIDIGYHRAFSSILDGHVTTFIGAAILYALGSASIKGFGLTLMLGTVWSMVTAIYVTRIFITFFIHTLGLRAKKLYGGL